MAIVISSQALRAARALAGLRQEELAARAGVDQKMVSKAETGRNLTADTLEKIRRALVDAGIEFSTHDEVTRANVGRGDLMRAARLFVGLTQAELAERAGLEQKMVSKAELGANQTRDTIYKLRSALEDAGVEFTSAGGSFRDGVRRRVPFRT